MTDTQSQAGGFLQPSLPSPPPSVHSTGSRTHLPTPRSQPLKSGGRKENDFSNYVENRLYEISGRYEKRFNVTEKDPSQDTDTNKRRGYENFDEVAIDLENLVDVIWVSATPSLQVPFLLNAALAFSEYVSSFPFSAKRTFALAQKLDLAFASLLQERNVESGEPLPGFSTGFRVTMTEKIRLKGLVETTRVAIAKTAEKMDESIDESRITDITEDEDEQMSGFNEAMESQDDDFGSLEMGIARVYERTLMDLLATLEGAHNIGVETPL